MPSPPALKEEMDEVSWPTLPHGWGVHSPCPQAGNGGGIHSFALALRRSWIEEGMEEPLSIEEEMEEPFS